MRKILEENVNLLLCGAWLCQSPRCIVDSTFTCVNSSLTVSLLEGHRNVAPLIFFYLCIVPHYYICSLLVLWLDFRDRDRRQCASAMRIGLWSQDLWICIKMIKRTQHFFATTTLSWYQDICTKVNMRKSGKSILKYFFVIF